MARLAAGATALGLAFGIVSFGVVSAGRAAGPPFPAPVAGQRVYDTAGIWSQQARNQADQTVRAMEDRTSSQIVIYSQIVGSGITGDEAKSQATALGTQWGVGRNGFNDGFVILFDIEPNLIHGQVALVGGDGFRAAYIADAESQRIIDQAIVPQLAGGSPDFDQALLAGLRLVSADVTPDRAAALDRARVVNAVIGVIGSVLVLVLVVGWAAFHWLRYGRDPIYLDDPSIHMAGPPADLTAASAALVYDGSSSRRALTTAVLDLASRGELAFAEHDSLLHKKIAVLTAGLQPANEQDAAWRRLNASRPLGDAEQYTLDELRALAPDGELKDDELLQFGSKVRTFNQKLELQAVAKGWFRDAPGRVSVRWSGLGGVVFVLGGIGVFAGASIPMSGLVAVGVAGLVAGGITVAIAQVMPARTMSGAMIRAMLSAYHRTLEETMAQARSMGQVVDEAKIDWLKTPDQALVWGVALGLQGPVEAVLQRSLEDTRTAGVNPAIYWFPAWYGVAGGGGGAAGAGGSLFSGSAVPDFGGMFHVLGSVGNSPSSSGGGGGSFGGGGGFGGGASGGF